MCIIVPSRITKKKINENADLKAGKLLLWLIISSNMPTKLACIRATLKA